jgi:hypothetical protein
MSTNTVESIPQLVAPDCTNDNIDAAGAPLAPERGRIEQLRLATELDQAWMTSSRGGRLWLALRRQLLSYYFVSPPRWRIWLRSFNAASRVMPDFACVGAVRSGTTQLADYVLQHPCIALPLAKETSLLSTPTARFIRAQFPTRRKMRAVATRYGRAMTGYFSPMAPMLSFPDFARAIAPAARVIVIMRDPVERTFSHWRWDQALLRSLKKDPLWKHRPTFEQTIELELDAIRHQGHAGLALSGMGAGYLRTSIYHHFVERVERAYPRDRILYVNATDFFVDPTGTTKSIYAFLGLPPFEPTRLPVMNSAPEGEMSARARTRLTEFFAPHNQRLNELLGRNLGWS